jgi:hypothetical protein
MGTRRYFLKKTALLSGGAVLLNTLPPFIGRATAINPDLVLPDIILHWDNKSLNAFKPGKKIATQVQLTKELIKMRKKYGLFMENFAPSLPMIRKRTELKKFSWRLVATEMGIKENGDLFPLPEEVSVSGENPWKEVTIPHYWGPINKAEAHYRKELYLNAGQLSADKFFLHFNGVDYVAEVYLNGHKIGTHTGLFGAFEFDIKPFAKLGTNLLEVKVFNDAIMMGDAFFLGPNRKFGKKLAADGGPGWDEPGYAKGWTMCPPGFGIWQRCYLETRSNAFINDVYLHPLLDESKVEVQIELPDNVNDAQISYSLYGQNFKETIAENHLVNNASIQPAPGAPGFTAYKFTVTIPKDRLRVWSLDEPWLYQVQVRVIQNGKWVDAVKQQFGMRSFNQPETSMPKGRFFLNGKEIKLRGANMMGNLMQCIIRNDYDQLRDDILLAKIAGMSFWRMTQQPCQPEVYEYFDKLGLLAQSDMPAFNGYRKDTIEEVKPQFVELIRMIRSHPCNALITYLNEPDFTKPMMLDRKGHEELFSGFDAVAGILNPGQIIKWIEGTPPGNLTPTPKYSGIHDYNMWYGNGIHSEYFGDWPHARADWMQACGEFGSEGLDNIELMEKCYPKKWLAIQSNGRWDPARIPRCQTTNTGRKWLNLTADTMEDWVKCSREYQMWATRLFTEALRRNPKMNSFGIHLLIDAWPNGWLKAIMDTERKAKPAYFAYRDALRPIVVNLRPNAFYGFSGERGKVAVFICNDTTEAFPDAILRYQLEFDKKILCTGGTKAIVPASNPQFQGWLEIPYPEVSTRQRITVRAGLFNGKDKLIHDSAYDLEVFPASDKGRKLWFSGGYPQQLIQ